MTHTRPYILYNEDMTDSVKFDNFKQMKMIRNNHERLAEALKEAGDYIKDLLPNNYTEFKFNKALSQIESEE